MAQNVHPSCEIHSPLPEHITVWHRSCIMQDVQIGNGTKIGRDVFIGPGSRIGANCKIQNGANIYGAIIGDGVLIGPGAIFIEDPWPRATRINIDNKIELTEFFTKRPVVVDMGASIGAGAILTPGITVGREAMVGAGAVVLKSVPANVLVLGNPAREISRVCSCGRREEICEFCFDGA